MACWVRCSGRPPTAAERRTPDGGRPHAARLPASCRDGSGFLFSDGTGLIEPSLRLDKGSPHRTAAAESTHRAGGDAVISPDGRWIAYFLVVSGTPAQIFVSAFPDLPAKAENRWVSPAGGSQPRWARGRTRAPLHGSRRRAHERLAPAVSRHSSASATATAGAKTPGLLRGPFEAPLTSSKGRTTSHRTDTVPDAQVRTGPGPPNEPATVVVVKNWVEASLRRLVPATR